MSNHSLVKAIVGLGNPGPRYANTWHNAGFAVVSELARRWGSAGSRDNYFSAMIAEARVADGKVLLVQPLTFMNLSGLTVRNIVKFYKIPLDKLVVVSDDVDLPIGSLRLRKKGSAGGQKGLQSIIDHLGSMDFPRLRIGIGPKPARTTLEEWVLSKVPAQECEKFELAIYRGADALEFWAEQSDFELAMNRFNAPC
ncbi:MAG: aminoacyl-tRNA hydrolase [Cyanobacteria bacterium NC_groundwater_1444_Ag_S-0.65um_54_12]|nr:aminoacyl-tRNA hydrolase [Cyanobacteria bacterium NC_groundwater_1444_Ag_S-0.65um_54_12]